MARVRALRPADARPRWHRDSDARQAILEKFEFFPIKCRTQRAYEGLKRREARGVAPSPMRMAGVAWLLEPVMQPLTG